MKNKIYVEIEVDEITEPQIFEKPTQLYTWRMQEGRVTDFLNLPVLAILPKTLCNSYHHANVICIKDGVFWWATNCAKIVTNEIKE